jgi:acyl-CoA reductase-like NAD-dependent aldehyde dehydrogenase
LLIAGEWVETGDWQEVRSPYSGDVVGRVANAGADETRRAIDAAESAMRKPLPAHKRAEILVRVAGMLGRRHDEVARLIADEAGKPLKAARIEASRAMSTYTFSAVEARKLAGEMVPMDASQSGEGKLAFTLRRPLGVVGGISPFNFPLNLVAHKIAPALAAGCAVVLKPASQTPLSALLLAELETEAGLPPGWLNVVVGPASEIGDALIEDERVKVITFTGSSGVGWKLRERAPRKRVNLELGNATPLIVEADADIEAAAAATAQHGFSFAGQSCISIQRVYVQRAVYDDFVQRLVPKVEALVLGDPAEEDTDVGPVIDEGARDRILDWIEEARTGGAEILTGGELEGELIQPTVIANASPDLKVSCEEVFGPVVTVNPYESLDEALELANGTKYGLQGGIFTENVRTALRAAQELEFGGVTVNEAPTFRADQMPYGGVKDSGNTREGPAYSVREFTEERVVVFDL